MDRINRIKAKTFLVFNLVNPVLILLILSIFPGKVIVTRERGTVRFTGFIHDTQAGLRLDLPDAMKPAGKLKFLQCTDILRRDGKAQLVIVANG